MLSYHFMEKPLALPATRSTERLVGIRCLFIEQMKVLSIEMCAFACDCLQAFVVENGDQAVTILH